jgi:hypothetical protein
MPSLLARDPASAAPAADAPVRILSDIDGAATGKRGKWGWAVAVAVPVLAVAYWLATFDAVPNASVQVAAVSSPDPAAESPAPQAKPASPVPAPASTVGGTPAPTATDTAAPAAPVAVPAEPVSSAAVIEPAASSPFDALQSSAKEEAVAVPPASPPVADKPAAKAHAAKTEPSKAVAHKSAAKSTAAKPSDKPKTKTADSKPAPAKTKSGNANVDLMEALVVHVGARPATPARAGKPEPRDPKTDIVMRDPNVSTAELIKRCRSLGVLEGELCRVRICSGQWGKDAACPASQPASLADGRSTADIR